MVSDSTSGAKLLPSDVATIGILVIVTSTLLIASIGQASLLGWTLLHAAMTVGFGLLLLFMSRAEGSRWVDYTRPAVTVAVMVTLYFTLGHVVFEAIPWSADRLLDGVDTVLFLGRNPALVVSQWATPVRVEFFSVFYAAFIPYVHLSLLLGCLGRPRRERDIFLTAYALLYAWSFLGYLALPARGPIVFLADAFAAPIEGGFVHSLVVGTIDAGGGPHGAFPSLHVGASMLFCLFDLRYNVLRGLLSVPFVGMIMLATVVLRYHYVIDLVAGFALALGAISLAHCQGCVQCGTVQGRKEGAAALSS